MLYVNWNNFVFLEQILVRWFKFPLISHDSSHDTSRKKKPPLSISRETILFDFNPPLPPFQKKKHKTRNFDIITPSTSKPSIIKAPPLPHHLAKGGFKSALPPLKPSSSKKEKARGYNLHSTPETNMIGGGAAGDGVHYGRLWPRFTIEKSWRHRLNEPLRSPVYRNNYRSIDTKGRWLAACLPACLHCRLYVYLTCACAYTGCPARNHQPLLSIIRKKVERFPYTILFVKINFTSWNISLHNSLNNKLTKKKKRQKLQTFSKTF